MAVDPAWLAKEFPQLRDIESLDAGGQKEVFSARTGAGARVVLKLFHATANPECVVRELNAVRGLADSRVPRILEVGTARSNVGQHIWFIEEFVEGETLRKRVQQGPQVRSPSLHSAVLPVAVRRPILGLPLDPSVARSAEGDRCRR